MPIGDIAPAFDCRAIVSGDLLRLDWSQVHRGGTLVLRFDSIGDYDGSPQALIEINDAVGSFERRGATVAMVWRDPELEILAWAGRSPAGGGPGALKLPMIVDSGGQVASLYGMVSTEGRTLWGHVIVGPDRRLRQIAVTDSPVAANVNELLRIVESIDEDRR